jgi:hypothetical protein
VTKPPRDAVFKEARDGIAQGIAAPDHRDDLKSGISGARSVLKKPCSTGAFSIRPMPGTDKKKEAL